MENNKSRTLTVFSTLALLLLATLGGWFVYGKYISGSSKNAASSLPTGWAKFTSDKYGIKFIYPKGWGEPRLAESSNGQKKTYQITFAPKTVTQRSLFAAIESDTPLPPDCREACRDTKAFTKSDIETSLSGDKESYVRFDETSYSILFSDPKNKLSQELFMDQMIDIPKLKATAVQITYYIGGDKECPTNSFAGIDRSDSCMTEIVYGQISKFAKSIKSL